MREIRIVIVGDEKVGKTSLIKSLISDSPQDDLQDIQIPIKVPSELCQTDCSATIIDTWYRQDTDCLEAIKSELSKSDVVLLVYDINKPETITRLKSFWCDLIKESCSSPIVIVGNKVDQKASSDRESLEDIMRPLVGEYKQCELILECSATESINLNEVFTFAQKVVLYPTSPLFDTINKELTDEFKRSLVLVFLRCDKGKRGVLSDSDIITMHAEVFATQLSDDDVSRIKEVIKNELPEGVDESGITFEGFCHLQKMMIKRQKINVCWNLVKHYGFNHDLKLVIDFVINKNSDQGVELTKAAVCHLEKLFNKYQTEGLLKFHRFQDIFKAAGCPPWDPENHDISAWRKVFEMVPSTNDGFSIHSWLALWHLLTLQDYHNALVYLVYTGCDISYSEIFLTTNEREVMEVNYRRIFCGFVLGDSSSDLLEHFLATSEGLPERQTRWACKVVEENDLLWESKYLVLISYSSGDSSFLRIIKSCDVAVIISDQDRLEIEEVIPVTIPRVRIKQDAPDVSLSKAEKLIFQFAFKPYEGLDDIIKEQMIRNRGENRTYFATFVGVVGVLATIGFLVFKKKITS